jgi:exosortase A-associated hydrolase 1
MSAGVVEQALVFRCEGEELLGVLHRPCAAASTGVVVVVGGPQYRAGSHRQFVELARRLAAGGFAVLRFDLVGMGDSSGAQRDFERATPDIGAAIAALREQLPRLERIVLYGLCDGASAALLYLYRCKDPAVKGLCLLNPWVRTPAGLARTYVKHYYLRRITQPDFWRKLLAGKVSPGAAWELGSHLTQAGRPATAPVTAAAPFPSLMAAAWDAFSGPILLVLSGDDYTAREFVDHAARSPDWRGHLERPNVTRVDLAAANHTFANAIDRRRVADAALAWLARLASLPAAGGGLQHHGGTRT